MLRNMEHFKKCQVASTHDNSIKIAISAEKINMT